MQPTVSLIVPTRERAGYLHHCLRSCLQNRDPQLELLVLDNASTDDTREVVSKIEDSRVRYVRNDTRLSMRNNFERGIELAAGKILCFLGDDDGLLPDAVARAIDIFETKKIDALAAARAHYFWPDLVFSRPNTALLPRGAGVVLLNSRENLLRLFDHGDYYRLPCVYHGFVRKTIIDRIRQRQGRFFLSSQVDIYSAIALSMEDMTYAFSRAPLVINGGSARSNGASHFRLTAEGEKQLWSREDDLGFLPGFDNAVTVPSLIVESALRYCHAHPGRTVFEMFAADAVEKVLEAEYAKRIAEGRRADEEAAMFESAGLARPSGATPNVRSVARERLLRLLRLARSFAGSRPIDMRRYGVTNVFEASQQLGRLRACGGARFSDRPWEQVAAAFRLVRN